MYEAAISVNFLFLLSHVTVLCTNDNPLEEEENRFQTTQSRPGPTKPHLAPWLIHAGGGTRLSSKPEGNCRLHLDDMAPEC